MAQVQDRIDMPWGRTAGSRAMSDVGGGSSIATRRRWSATTWLQALLLAFAPLLVVGFYNVVDGAVERAAARRMVPPAGLLHSAGVQPVRWECSVLPGTGVHNACRPLPVGDETTTRQVAGN